ncbi:MAG TPA: N-acetylmuramoyl-L-alanine amidase [Prolixibacteraceae bacterium]|nr:N-acetylmuramoyl-L-alanine amidase [Prolixibacteraceae bacterium]
MPESTKIINTSKNKKFFLTKLLLTLFFILSALPFYAQEYKIITAKNGDGIYKVLRENNIPSSYFNEFIDLNKATLKGKQELKTGFRYKLPNVGNQSIPEINENNQANFPGKTIKRFSIFGSKYQDVIIESDELSGAVFHLVSGHGGPDPGAVAKYNNKTLCEDEYAYDITLRLARSLIAKGATVNMIIRDPDDGIRDGWYLAPDKDEVCYPNLTIPINQNARLKQRTEAVNKLYGQNKGKYQRLIVIHVDSRSKGEKIDVFFYYDKRSKNGKKLANNLRNIFDQKYQQHQPGRGYHGSVTERNLYVLKYSYPVAAYVELGNINHHRDLLRFIVDENRQALAKWLTEGLVNDFVNNRE